MAVLHQFATACHLNIEVSDLLSERISVNSEQIRALGLISTRRLKRDFDQRCFDLAEDSRIEARRREHRAVQVEIAAQVAGDRRAEFLAVTAAQDGSGFGLVAQDVFNFCTRDLVGARGQA